MIAIGVVMIFSISSIAGYQHFGDSYYFIKRHLLSLFIGLFLAVAAYAVDLDFYRKAAPWALIISPFLLLLTYIPTFAVNIGGSSRWVNLGLFSFQPSEFVKLFLIIYLANAIANKKDSLRDFFFGLLPLLSISGLIIVLILKSPDLGTSVILTSTVFFMLYIGGANGWHIIALLLVGIRTATWLIWRTAYQKSRFLAFLNPWEDPLGKGFHLIQSLIAIGSGGFWGVGLGQSTQKFSYLPQQFTDFVFSILSEELGFVGSFLILLLIGFILYRSLKIAYDTDSTFIRLMTSGIAFMIFLQSIFNIMVSASMIPPTGLTLPLISYGGSSLVTTLMESLIKMKIAIACGGTAGHIFPAIAFAQYAQTHQIIFIGGDRFEKKIIPEYDFRFYQLKVMRKNIWKLIHSFFKTIQILRHEKCQVVLATGGYATLPVLLAAIVLRIPFFLHEQNVLPGRLNRLFARLAQKVFISYEESSSYFQNSCFTANPVRKEVAQLAESIRPQFPPKKILIFGGSLGSRNLNILAEKMKKYQQYQIMHISSYTDRIVELYQDADFIVCRAGATSIAEITSLGIPALYVPYPLAKDDHQTLNAKVAVKQGSGFTIQDQELSEQKLVKILQSPEIKEMIKTLSRQKRTRHDQKKVQLMLELMQKAVVKT